MRTTSALPTTLRTLPMSTADSFISTSGAPHLAWLMHLRTLLRFGTTLMLPLAFFKGTWESSTTWSQLPLPKGAYLACLPLILLACLADVLYFNRPYFAAIIERRLLSSWRCVLHFCVEAALCSLTLVCCWAVGVVWFQVWTIMHGASALSMATLGLLILAAFYVNVTSQRPYSPSSESPINEGDKQVFVGPAESDIHSQVGCWEGARFG